MLTIARDFDLCDFSAISSLVLFHGAAKLRGYDLFQSLLLLSFVSLIRYKITVNVNHL